MPTAAEEGACQRDMGARRAIVEYCDARGGVMVVACVAKAHFWGRS